MKNEPFGQDVSEFKLGQSIESEHEFEHHSVMSNTPQQSTFRKYWLPNMEVVAILLLFLIWLHKSKSDEKIKPLTIQISLLRNYW